MTCALCQKNEANKKNTHYLTDGIIRTCLNIDGTNARGKGLLFDMSSNTPFVDFNFQQDTPVQKLEELLGRPASNEEIEGAKQNSYSVDNIFCSECEKIFTEIETNFISQILPKLRDVELDGIAEKHFAETKLIRLFFYLQIWRSSVCEHEFTLSEQTKERLRKIILNYAKTDVSDLNDFPLSIYYLYTKGDKLESTTNFVGYSYGNNPSIILMCDFIVWFYESNESLGFFDLHGLISIESYKKDINYKEAVFTMKIVSNEERKEFIKRYLYDKKFKPFLDLCQTIFIQGCKYTHKTPTQTLFNDYVQTISKNEGILQFSQEELLNLTIKFFQNIP